jgi:hypothetical protein
MRTKTLLIAAAALAATVTASKAQTVYSQNVVGYVNVTVTNGTLAMVANQLDTGSNTVDNVLQSGLTSQKATILEWNGAGYNQYTYYNSSDAVNDLGGTAAGWFDGNGNPWGETNYIQPEYGFFLRNTAVGAGALTLPTVGQVIQGTNVYTVPSGSSSIYSLPEPLAGLPLDNTNINLPAISQKTIYESWNGAGYNQYTYYNSSDAVNDLGGTAPGWYDGNGNDVDGNSAVWPTAGQSFFIRNTSTKTLNWTNVFEVQ